MKGDFQTWEDANALVMRQLSEAIQMRKSGDDAYKRWPLDLFERLEARMKAMQVCLDFQEGTPE